MAPCLRPRAADAVPAMPPKKEQMKAKIRLSVPADAQALRSVDSAVPADPTRAGLIEKWLREETVVVAELDGRVVGYGGRVEVWRGGVGRA